MDLTAWQRICNRLLGPFVKKRARNDKELSANLVKGSMGMMPEVYLSTVIVTSIAIALMSWAFVAIFFIPDKRLFVIWWLPDVLSGWFRGQHDFGPVEATSHIASHVNVSRPCSWLMGRKRCYHR